LREKQKREAPGIILAETRTGVRIEPEEASKPLLRLQFKGKNGRS